LGASATPLHILAQVIAVVAFADQKILPIAVNLCHHCIVGGDVVD